jgi:hypothetical protein
VSYRAVPDPFGAGGMTVYNSEMRETPLERVAEPEPLVVTGRRVTVAHGPSGGGLSTRSAWAHPDPALAGAVPALSVEDLVVAHYALPAHGGYRGIHAEGRVWTTLYALVTHAAMFSGEVRDVFHHSYQDAPLVGDRCGGGYLLACLLLPLLSVCFFTAILAPHVATCPC